MDITKLLKINLVEEMGIDKLPRDRQEKILLDMGDVIFQRIIIRIAQELSDEQKVEINKLIDSRDLEGFGKYVEENIDDADEIVQEEVVRYKKDLLDFTSNLKEK